MTMHPALERYAEKVATPEAAVKKIQPGSRIFVGSAAATPRTMLRALERAKSQPADVELLHFLTTGATLTDEKGNLATTYRHRTFFVGADFREAVRQGWAEYVPISAARVPKLMEIGRIPVDVALIQVTPPDAFGYVSLGVSVDMASAAVAAAKLVIAEVNPALPWTMGDSTLPVSAIDVLVPVEEPVVEYVHVPADDEAVHRIARYIAGVIDDGSTLQIGLGRIPNEALRYLEDRADLGIHSDSVTDSIIPLLEKGILTGKRKSDRKGKVVTSFAFGTRRLFDLIDRNPLFLFEPIEKVADPSVIAAQHKMVSVTQAFAIDLTGQVCADQFDGVFYSGLGAQAEFTRGASRSPGGKAILCLTSTTDDGSQSRIRPQLRVGEGVTMTRSDVHYVVTEYGIAYLFGKSLRERAIALIDLAHPKFRAELLEEAKRLRYVPEDQTLRNLQAYPIEEERELTLKSGRVVRLRPAHAADADGIRDLFHKMSEEDRFTRFFQRLKQLSNRDVQRLCNLNYETEVAFVAVTGPREQETVVGQSCYFVNPSTNLAETAFMVDPGWQGTGLGSAMQRRMTEHAKARGIRGFVAEILPGNEKMIALAKGGAGSVHTEKVEDVVHVTALF
jgi:acyl-CoA hydrolase/L-amino acid N-acyltransferase YncA